MIAKEELRGLYRAFSGLKLKHCKRCASTNVELIGANVGDTPFILCHDCSLVFDVQDENGIPISDAESLVAAWNRRKADG